MGSTPAFIGFEDGEPSERLIEVSEEDATRGLVS